jgi:tocopherol O-methyltransferase
MPKPSFTTDDVADYYNQTQIHYERWWKLSEVQSLHYGIWENDVKSFEESLKNTNQVLLTCADVPHGARILDAGCGVGGAALFLAAERDATVTGISLSEKQIKTAKANASRMGFEEHVNFEIQDYTQTNFEDNTFDVVWACESSSSAIDKKAFITEAFRVLKPGGRIVVSDFFRTSKKESERQDIVDLWGETWGISEFVTKEFFHEGMTEAGFSSIDVVEKTAEIKPSVTRMYNAYLLGAVGSKLYNLFHPKVTRFAKTHYLCGYYQYKAYHAKLWSYQIFSATKP